MGAVWWLVGLAHAGTQGFDHSHAALSKVLAGAVSAQGVDYDRIASRREALDAYLATIAAVDASNFEPAQRLALYVNAYNAYTVQLVLDHRPLQSIRDLDGGNPWKVRTFVVAGETLTLDAIEHQRVRKLGDGRVHAVVNCASRGCPPLPSAALAAEGLQARLDEDVRRWVGANAYRVTGGTLELSRIFEWYAEDFAAWRKQDHPAANDAQDAALGFLQAFGVADLPDFEQVAWQTYDWTLNDAS